MIPIMLLTYTAVDIDECIHIVHTMQGLAGLQHRSADMNSENGTIKRGIDLRVLNLALCTHNENTFR